jgi:hypothetical protein
MPIFVDVDNSNLKDKRFKADKDKVGDASAKAEEKMQKTAKAALADDPFLWPSSSIEARSLFPTTVGYRAPKKRPQPAARRDWGLSPSLERTLTEGSRKGVMSGWMSLPPKSRSTQQALVWHRSPTRQFAIRHSRLRQLVAD